MIQLNTKPLTAPTATHLETVQQRIDNQISFDKKTNKAITEWDSKSKSIPKKAAFDEIKETLIELCVSVEVCNYCENNEGNDIEHIYPKSLFPEQAFKWDNYLLACKTCNTAYKLDSFAIFVPEGSSSLVKLPRGQQPANNDGAIVNPRTDNPLDFFWLDIENRSFVLDAKLGLSDRDSQKAVYTLELLGLNNRDTLVEARRAAAKYYLDRLDRYIRTGDAATFDELDNTVHDPEVIDRNLPLESEKQRIRKQIVNDIKTYVHPTVWKELIRQRERLTRTNQLLNSAPEALAW